MRLLIMGPPGAGKGTQAVLIQKEYNIPHISTGDMFRNAISKQTELGMKAKTYMDEGNLVPDELTIGIVRERLQEEDAKSGFLLDGFPRTIPQAEALDEILNDLSIKIDAVINIVVEDNSLIDRIVGRRVCKKCGAGYHVVTKKPQVEGVCDICGGELEQRKDDTVETVKNRLNVYNNQTKPLLDYYQKRKLVVDVDGLGNIEEIFKKIKNLLGGINDFNKK